MHNEQPFIQLLAEGMFAGAAKVHYVQSDYLPATPFTSGLWRFNEMTGGTITDVSGRNFTGIFLGKYANY